MPFVFRQCRRFVGDIESQSSGFLVGEIACGASSMGNSELSLRFFSFQRCFAFFDMECQSGGFTGFVSEFLCDGGCSSVSAAGATRDSNSESPTCIGGGLDIRVVWSPELGGFFGLGDPRRFMGGRAGDGDDVLGEEC